MPSHPEEGIWCRQQGEQGVEGKMILGEGQGQRGEREYGSEAGQGEKLLVGRAGTGKGTGPGTGTGTGTWKGKTKKGKGK